jgi:hypothetical protein
LRPHFTDPERPPVFLIVFVTCAFELGDTSTNNIAVVARLIRA